MYKSLALLLTLKIQFQLQIQSIFFTTGHFFDRAQGFEFHALSTFYTKQDLKKFHDCEPEIWQYLKGF